MEQLDGEAILEKLDGKAILEQVDVVDSLGERECDEVIVAKTASVRR